LRAIRVLVCAAVGLDDHRKRIDELDDQILKLLDERAGVVSDVARAKREANLHVHDILEWCRGRLAPMKLPRYVVFADSLPHTPSHRVAKHRLKSDATLLGRAVDTQPTRPA